MLVCDSTVNGKILGDAETEEQAVSILRVWGQPLRINVPGAVVRQCLLESSDSQGERTVRAWVVATQPADVLIAVSRRIWGDNWQSALGRAIGVNDRTVRHWAAGERSVPDGVLHDLRQWLLAESDRLMNIAEKIS